VGTYEDLRNTIEKYAFKESSDAGDYVDGLIRIFLTPNAATVSKFSEFNYNSTVELKGRQIKISDIMSRKAFDKLFAPVTPTSQGGIITKFRLGIVDGTYIILSENVKLFDKSLREGRGVTGEVDLLLIKEDGSVAIVDIKTKKIKEVKGQQVSGWKDFGNPEALYESSTYFRAQQSIYGYQFYNSTAITPELKLMPFDMELSKEKIGYIEDISLADIVPAGQDTFDLEYLPEIENFGIVKIKPEIKAPVQKIETPTQEMGQGIPESDPVMNKLKDNVDKAVIFNGRTGKLVRMSNGAFGVEVVVNSNITGLQLTLDALQANLAIEKGEFGNPELIGEIENQIKKISEAIESTKGLTEVFPLQVDSKNVTNGDVTLDKAGVQLVIPIQSVGQLSTVNGQVINAAFSNKEESIATINGVKYEVLRDASGNITVLSYMSNDEMISQINKQVGEMAAKISDLRNSVTVEANTNRKDSLLNRIAKLQEDIRTLDGKRKSLMESNKKMYLYGENANNYIFALNRLPNNFQRLTANATKANETQDLKSISNLSSDSTIADTITEILSDQYPEALDKLIDGETKDLTSGDLLKIQLWIEDSIERLNQLGYTVINRGDIIDDITNQINALNEVRNNLELIKLTKDGKIFNYKQIAEVFREQGVQEGTGVSKDAGTTRKPSEGVSRPATREELKDLVKQAREENLGETFGEPTAPTVNSAAVEKIMNATLSNIDEVYETEFLKAQANDEDITGLTEAYNTRLQELKTVVSIQNVEVGEYLISKNPIFTDISGEIFQVVEVWYGTIVTDNPTIDDRATEEMHVTLKNIKTNETRAFTEAELVENFEKTTMEATQPEPEATLTAMDVEDSKESKGTIDDLIKNGQDAISEAKEKAKTSDRNSRWNKLGDNSKLC
jgi:hypothetical protein